MRTVLALAGCGPCLEVGLRASQLSAPTCLRLASPTPRSDLSLRGVHLALEAAQLEPSQLQLVVVTRGPGSFTGIRNSLSAVLGLHLATGVAAHGFSSLLVQAARCDEGPVLSVQPARKGWVYAQPFALGNLPPTPLADPALVALEELGQFGLPVVAPTGLALPPVRRAVAWRATAEALLALAETVEIPDPATLEPCYLEPAAFGREAEKVHGSPP